MELKTIEKALTANPNRFELTMMAVARAKELAAGDIPLVDAPAGRKPVVVAVEEIAAGALTRCTRQEMDTLREVRKQAREQALLAEQELEEGQEEVALGTFNPLLLPDE